MHGNRKYIGSGKSHAIMSSTIFKFGNFQLCLFCDPNRFLLPLIFIVCAFLKGLLVIFKDFKGIWVFLMSTLFCNIFWTHSLCWGLFSFQTLAQNPNLVFINNINKVLSVCWYLQLQFKFTFCFVYIEQFCLLCLVRYLPHMTTLLQNDYALEQVKQGYICKLVCLSDWCL